MNHRLTVSVLTVSLLWAARAGARPPSSAERAFGTGHELLAQAGQGLGEILRGARGLFRPQGPSRPLEAFQEAAAAKILASSFSPRELKIKAGTRVVWTNSVPMRHTVTSDDGLFGSGLLDKGQSFERLFTQPGTFKYHCHPHPFMQATVIVE